MSASWRSNAVVQHRHTVQPHLPQLLHRIVAAQRPAGLSDGRRSRGIPRRDRARRPCHEADRLHRRRAVHESASCRRCWRRAVARLQGAGADQRDAADAQDEGGAARRCAQRHGRNLAAAGLARPLRARPCTRPSAGREAGGRRSTDWSGWPTTASTSMSRAGASRTSRGARARGLCAAVRRAGRADRRRRPGSCWCCSRKWIPTVDVPEITTACWGILKKSPDSVMCASSRMVVKRKGAAATGGRRLHAAALRSAVRAGRDAGRQHRRGAAQSSALRQVLRPGRRRLQPVTAEIDVVIPTLNAAPSLARTLAALRAAPAAGSASPSRSATAARATTRFRSPGGPAPRS